MSKPNYQSIIISRTTHAAPNLKYVSLYSTNDDWVSACMSGYENRSFVYLLTFIFNEEEVCIYVGKSKSQYARFISHIKNFDFSHIFLFECEEKEITQSEKLVIKEFKPLYNINSNPLATRYSKLLNIVRTKYRTFDEITNDLRFKYEYEKSGLFGFALNPAIFSVLQNEANKNNCNCSEMLQLIFENLYSSEISEQLRINSDSAQTNLTTTNKYAEKHNRSRESIKQFLKDKNRISGAKRIGRDWIFPEDTYFPKDKRKK